MIDNLSIAVHAFHILMLTSLSVDEILLSTNFRSLTFKVEMTAFCLKYMNSVLFTSSLWTINFVLASGYAVRIRFGWVYSPEAVDHLHSLHPWWFQRDIICFLPFFYVNSFSSIFFYYWRSLRVILVEYKHIWWNCISFQDSNDNDEEVGVSIRWVKHCFRVFIKHHYSCNSFFCMVGPYASCIRTIFHL